MSADYVTVGQILGASGLRGDLRIRSFTRPDDEILDLKGWMLSQDTRSGMSRTSAESWKRAPQGPFVVQSGRLQGKHLIAKLQGIDDRNAAEALVGASISIAADAMPDPDPGQYYWDQLVGLKVHNLAGEDLGIVDHLVETGANDVLVVQTDAAPGEERIQRLLPWIDSVVVEVDLEQGGITVDWDASF